MFQGGIVDTPHNTLPSEQQIRLAISGWFRGGGWTSLIVACLRREMATLEESQEVAERLARKLNEGLYNLTDAIVSNSLETVRAVGAVQQTRETEEAKSPNPSIGSAEWYRRATERAQRNEWAENPYKTWKWEKPKAQQRSWT